MLFEGKTEYDEEGIVFYPNGDISVGELEKILHTAHVEKYPDSQEVECYERVRLSDSSAEAPEYGRRPVKVTIGEIKRIYGGPYEPNPVMSNSAVYVIINGNVYDIGS